MKTTVIIEWDKPTEEPWLNPDNIEVALSAHCKNTKFKVKRVDYHEALRLVREYFGRGCQAFCLERWEQIHEHGFDTAVDEWHTHNELIKAALFAINPDQFEWPFLWDDIFREKILSKDHINRLRVSGAFLAAEYDRLKEARNMKVIKGTCDCPGK